MKASCVAAFGLLLFALGLPPAPISFLGISAALAASPPEQGRCVTQETSDDDRIAACSAVLQAPGLSKEDLASAYKHRGIARYNKGDYTGAIADYSQAISLDPRPVLYHYRANARSAAGDNAGAIADLTQVISLTPSSAAYNDRGVARAGKRDYDGAIADYTQAISLDPKLAIPYKNRGMARNEAGDYDGAIADQTQAIGLDPKYGEAFYHRGIARENKSDYGGAIADLTLAISLDQSLSGSATAFLESAVAARAAAAGTSAAQAASSPAETRVALVIGNSDYKAVPALPNPHRDAETVADTLRRVGFQTVTLVDDLDREEFIEALHTFARQAESADWAVIYYAGHGIEMGGANYLIPVDAQLATDRDVGFEAIPLDQVMSAVEGSRKLRVVILDACRNNPFASQMRRTTASRAIGRGLARVEPDNSGTLVVYAAKEGETALDGEGGNSPFVAALAQRLPTPGIEINKLFRLVRDDVLKATGNQQEPFVYGSLPGEDFFFASE